jgi:hypothetical protein
MSEENINHAKVSRESWERIGNSSITPSSRRRSRRRSAEVTGQKAVTRKTIRSLLKQYTEMEGHPSFRDWLALRDRAIIALKLTEDWK